MAYAALASLAQTIDKLLHHQNVQYSISLPEIQQIISANEYISILKDFLENSHENASLEGRIREVANKAEDIIEYFMLEQIQSSNVFTRRQPKLRFQYDFEMPYQELRVVTEEIFSITGVKMEIKKGATMEIKQGDTTKEAQPGETSVATVSSSTSKEVMVGFDDDLMEIKTRLCGESSKLEVIPIFGMGGIGKTTLARNAFDDPLTVEYFDVRTWVTASQNPSAQEIFSSLLDSMKLDISECSNELMRELVYKILKGRRYLIVIDDIWSIKAWDDVKMVFPDDHNGSRIMITTRIFDVAAYPDSSSPIHEMRFINADQSWNLLQQKVFTRGHCPPELENIGREIARSCGGLPLAIVLIAGLLSTVSKIQASWQNIAENVNLVIDSSNDECFARILLFSYTHLPHHLRPCFLYMGNFPEDYEIRVSKLIKLWVAEGFLKPNVSKSFEQVAEEYLEDLVQRSLLLVIKKKPNGKIKSCGFHDLVRDLCIRKAQEEKFHLNVIDRHASKVLLESIKTERRIITDDLDCLKNISDSTIRTIICFHPTGSSLGSLRNFRLLRVLDVVTAHFMPFYTIILPIEVFELSHLRYLAFTCGKEYVLPSSISKLRNLQTLIIHPEGKYLFLSPLPLEICWIRQLRHLIFYGPLPDTLDGYLENLQTLLGVTNFKCTEKILKMIPNLKTLGIIYSGEEYVEDSHLENLVHLHQLEKLKLEVYPFSPFKGKLNHFFSASLKKLSLSAWGLPWEDMSILGLLPTLQVLKLRNFACHGDKWETREGEFCQLKFLLIEDSKLQYWIVESSHFPSLKCLVLNYCDDLSEIPDGVGEIPTLELIEVDDRNKSLVESAKRIQEEQQSLGNDALQVHVRDT